MTKKTKAGKDQESLLKGTLDHWNGQRIRLDCELSVLNAKLDATEVERDSALNAYEKAAQAYIEFLNSQKK